MKRETINKLMAGAVIAGVFCLGVGWSTKCSAANFGPSPDFATDDSSVTVDDVNAFVQTHVLAISVNGVYYKTLTAFYVYANANGTHAVYRVTNAVLHSSDGRSITASAIVEYWTTRLANGRITPHNFVDGGSVQP